MLSAARPRTRAAASRSTTMAKGLNQKKTEKKKPEKSLKEKRAEKEQKKAARKS